MPTLLRHPLASPRRSRLRPGARLIIEIIVAGAIAVLIAFAGPRTHSASAISPTGPRALPAIPSPSPAPAPTAASPAPSSSESPADSPVPRPTAAPPPSPPASPPSGGSGGCGFFDVTCTIKQAIDGWFTDLVKNAINPVFSMLGTSLLATPQLDHWPRVTGLWDGSLLVANTVFIMFVLAGGLILMGYGSLQTSFTVKDIAPRLAVAMVLSNVSLLLVGQAITLANALSAALLGPGVDPASAARQMSAMLLHALSPADVGMFVVAVTVWTLVLALILTFIYVIRIMLTILLIAAAPLALACHALPQTEGLAKLWWRAFTGVLAIQVAQALVFITAMRIFFTTDMVTTFGVRTPRNYLDLWIVACLLYILIRIPSWISRQIWRGGLGGSPITRTGKTIVALLIFRRLRAAIGAGARTARRRPRPGP